MPDVVHPKCGKHWTGARACHCAACCETFSCTATFDRHQRDGQCREPATVGLVARSKPWGVVWGYASRPGAPWGSTVGG